MVRFYSYLVSFLTQNADRLAKNVVDSVGGVASEMVCLTQLLS